jgi:hypothetical protein
MEAGTLVDDNTVLDLRFAPPDEIVRLALLFSAVLVSRIPSFVLWHWCLLRQLSGFHSLDRDVDEGCLFVEVGIIQRRNGHFYAGFVDCV